KMNEASKNLAFEEAALYRDRIKELEQQELAVLEGL
ncbi:MAG: UvrB/UvrC motif-containing protein, partial [Deltaproteobacteria bacterium]|nr:UvrB/UvrC motif-containing protein [Deltaproteobacteria bacterium]